MKLLLVGVLITGALFIILKRDIVVCSQSLSVAHSAFSHSNDTISFISQIQPILVNRCCPCHFTGGKMYERLPFDKAETIVTHEVALLRRIKDINELALIKKFIQEQKK